MKEEFLNENADCQESNLKEAEAAAAWEKVVELAEGETRPAKATVLRIMKNKKHHVAGLVVAAEGVEGFMPASLTGIARNEKVADYLGKEMDAVIIKVDKAQRNMILAKSDVSLEEQAARRDAREEAKEQKLRESYSKVAVGQVIKGRVITISRYGLLVHIGNNLRGLVHRSNLPWELKRGVELPVTKGDELDVVIKEIDTEKWRISLALADLDVEYKAMPVAEEKIYCCAAASKAFAAPAAKAEPAAKVEVKAEAKPEVKAEAKAEVKQESAGILGFAKKLFSKLGF